MEGAIPGRIIIPASHPSWFSPETGIYGSRHPPRSLPQDPFQDLVSFLFSRPHRGETALVDSLSGISISYPDLLSMVNLWPPACTTLEFPQAAFSWLDRRGYEEGYGMTESTAVDSPADLEALLISHAEILDAAVTSAFDEEAGEIPVAFVVRKLGSNLCSNAIMEFVAKQMLEILFPTFASLRLG
ncbi:hypothetical protein HPP92_003337 [Vanilla planifolia]|uniref:4-coumarate--CoA ligase n=1 Tax=Vanilla planifolia TaxID=51239 RepID=A0A835S231_VANPL|nr:hypothetical protein HPP92_003337 [Vanilla planifolia]